MPKTRGVNEENSNFNLPLKTEPTFFMYGNGRKLSQSVITALLANVPRTATEYSVKKEVSLNRIIHAKR